MPSTRGRRGGPAVAARTAEDLGWWGADITPDSQALVFCEIAPFGLTIPVPKERQILRRDVIVHVG